MQMQKRQIKLGYLHTCRCLGDLNDSWMIADSAEAAAYVEYGPEDQRVNNGSHGYGLWFECQESWQRNGHTYSSRWVEDKFGNSVVSANW